MAISRRTEKRIVKTIGIAILIVFLLYVAMVVVVLAFFEIQAQRDLSVIQVALDQACGVGVVQANSSGYDWEFSGYASTQAGCDVDGRGGYRCHCYTPTPTPR